MKTTWQQLRDELPINDAKLSDFCFRNHLAHWRPEEDVEGAGYAFPYETLVSAVYLWKNRKPGLGG